jgi:hypothetical protein
MKKRILALTTAVATAGLLCLAGSSAASSGDSTSLSATDVGSNSTPNGSLSPFPNTSGSGTLYSPADAGYVLTPGTISGFKYVSATFVLPSFSTCSSASAAIHLVGLGGWNGNNILAAVGVDEGCTAGVAVPFYYGYWYDDFYQHFVEDFVPNWFLAPGDTIFTSVLGNAGTGTYTYTLNDITTGNNFSTTYTCGGTACASATAEIFTATFQNNGSTPVPNFGNVNFTDVKVTPLGQSGTEGINNAAWTTTKVIDYGTSTSDVVVQPGSIGGDSNSSTFTNTWEHGS